MKKIKLFLAAVAAMVGLSAQAQTDAQYDAAIAAIPNGNYGIVAVVNGQTLVLKSDGYLTDDAYGVGTFAISQKTGGEVKGTGFRIAGTGRFTNGGDNNNVITSKNRLAVQTGQDRATFECQVLYLNDEGYCAVRSTNSSSTSWGATAYWDVVDDNDGDYLPNATYSFDNVPYVWKFVPEADFAEVLTTVSNARKTRILAQLNSYKNDAAYTNDKTNLTNAIAAIEAASTIEEIHNATSSIATIIAEFSYANSTYPLDKTSLITNPNFETAGGAGWTMEAGNKNLYGGAGTQHNAESWQSAFTLSQTVTVPNGYYRLRAQATLTDYTGAYDGANYPVVYAGDQTATFTEMDELDRATNMTQLAVKFSGNKYYTAWTPTVTVTGKSITIGVKGTRTDTWCIWDNFQLQYLGPIDLSEYMTGLANSVAAAKATEGTIPSAAYQKIDDVVTQYNKTYDNDEDYTTAIQAINSAVSTYASSTIVAAYAGYKASIAVRAKAVATAALSDLASSDATTLNGVITAADEAIEASETEAALLSTLEAQEANLWNAIGTAINTITLNEGDELDLTYLLTNPDLTSLPSWRAAAGWYTEQTTGNSQVMNNENATSEDGTKTKFYEYWTYTAQANNKFALYQKVTLPEGTYSISCYAFAKEQDDPANTGDKRGVMFYANDTQGSAVYNSRLSEAGIDFINDKTQEVKIGLKTISPNSYNWMGIGYVTLKKVPASTTTYAITTSADKGSVAVTVDGAAATEALALKTVTLTVTPDEDYVVSKVTATYNDGEKDVNLDVANPSTNVYTYQQPAYAVNVNVSIVPDKSALVAAINAANITEGSVPTAVYNAYNTALTTAQTVNGNADATVNEIKEATTALTEATSLASSCVTPTTWNSVILAKANTTAALDKLAEENKNILQNVINANTSALAACTSVAEIEKQNSALWTAISVAIESINITGDETLDLTYLLTNPDVTGQGNGAKLGWYTDQKEPVQNSQAMTTNNTVANSTDNTKYAFYEYWSYNTEATNGFTVYQKVTLPEGTYQMNALAVAGWGGGARYVNGARNVTFSANDVDGTQITTSTLEEASLEFVQNETSEVKIGLKAHEGNTSNWMGIGYVTFYKVADKTINISESVDYTPQSTAGKVELKRTITANVWNTIVLPFQLNADELKAAFGNDVQIAEFSDAGDSEAAVTVNFNVMDTPAITPNKPVLLKTSTAGTEYTFEGRTIAAGEAKAAGTYVDFVGTYAAKTTIAEGNYFISADKLYKSTGATTVKGTRAYIDAKNAPAGVKLFIDGITTGISEINGEAQTEQGAIYTLSGQRVSRAQKGVFIVNGKKVAVK